MNILEQEDMVKGLPDQILIQQAQMPTGEIPQFLVVSELDRRQKMRKSFAERVPEETVTDQVISQGIAAMNPNPDPLMATAMGAQPPQDPMMSQQMPPQDPMMMPPQYPMMMAAGGGMMPYRMAGEEYVGSRSAKENISPRDHIGAAFELLDQDQMTTDQALSYAFEQLKKAKSSEELEDLKSAIEYKAITSTGMPEEFADILYNYSFEDNVKEMAGGRMTPYRMAAGEQVPSIYDNSPQAKKFRQLLSDGYSEAEALKMLQFVPAGETREELASSIYDYPWKPRVLPKPGTWSPETREEMMQREFGSEVPELFSSLTRGPAARGRFMEYALSGEGSGVIDKYYQQMLDKKEAGRRREELENKALRFQRAESDSNLLRRPPILSYGQDAFGDGLSPPPDLLNIAETNATREDAASLTDPKIVTKGQTNPNDAELLAGVLGGNAGGVKVNPLAAELQQFTGIKAPTNRQLDFSNLEALLKAEPIDYKKLGVDYTDLLAREEARSKRAAEELREDAINNAIIQMGAGIASGDLAKGISDAGTAAMAGRKEARAEEKELSSLQRQIELAKRQQESTLGIKGAEADRVQKREIAQFGLEKQKELIQSDERVYDAYIKMKTLEQKKLEAPTEEERQADLNYKRGLTNYYNSIADSKLYDTAFTPAELDAFLAAQLDPQNRLTGPPEKIDELRRVNEMTLTQQREWAKMKMLTLGGAPDLTGKTSPTGRTMSFTDLPPIPE